MSVYVARADPTELTNTQGTGRSFLGKNNWPEIWRIKNYQRWRMEGRGKYISNTWKSMGKFLEKSEATLWELNALQAGPAWGQGDTVQETGWKAFVSSVMIWDSILEARENHWRFFFWGCRGGNSFAFLRRACLVESQQSENRLASNQVFEVV